MKKLFSFCVALLATTALWAGNFTPAAFTVSADGKQVYFSKGNLQCTLSATDTIWDFAENQYDMLGTDNVIGGTDNVLGSPVIDSNGGEYKTGTSLADKIDLFGWSANNTTAPWGISTSGTSQKDYLGDFVDWGKNIGNGNTWRTLTSEEWKYLLKTRTNYEKLQGVARIQLSKNEYVNGLILLPDAWTDIEGVTFKSGFSNSTYGSSYVSYASSGAYARYQTFTLDEWQKLEAAGAIFFPATGNRIGKKVQHVTYSGSYWSATPFFRDTYEACNGLNFSVTGASTSIVKERSLGNAVRLVQDVTVNIAVATNGKIEADNTVASIGETVTLTATAEAGYELDKITVTYGDGQEVEVSADNIFIMPAADVMVSATFKKIDYVININKSENGTIEVDKDTAQIDDEVTLNILPDEGYSLNFVLVQDDDNNEIELTDNKFSMPASNVFISADFQPITAIPTIEFPGFFVKNGRIIYNGEFQIFTVTGIDVTNQNGSLNGVYIVKIGDKTQKVVVTK